MVILTTNVKGCETMAWEDVVTNIGRRLTGDVCPQCKRAWIPGSRCPYCGYSPKIIACPKCAEIVKPSIAERRRIMSDPQKAKTTFLCSCNAPYIELDMTYDEYNKIYYSNYKTESWWPDRWIASAHILAEYATNRPIFENLFDKSQLDMDSDAYKFHYALMYPESEESIERYKQYGGIENYYFPQNPDATSRAKHVPKCPICGSENLTRLTTMRKAAKIALVGIYGLGDCGKTWKCNNCGSKF